MTTTPPLKYLYTFEEYLNYDDGTDNHYELVDGELVMVPLPTGDHSDVIDLLAKAIEGAISQQQVPWIVKRDVGVYVGINTKTGRDRSRTPDLTVLTQAQWSIIKANKNRAAVSETAPLLVIEIVSPGSKRTDYKDKEQEYKNIGIPEYWIVDMKQSQVTVLMLVDGNYKATVFTGNQQIVSQTFPGLALTAQKILTV